ncbi:hypothetical protein HNQ71_005551 [Mesorhizobium sangaii]|uniref:Guanylate cyclase domain-containing protein n=1 Tax=Mesorhizobium sangaii TaxID=505389 RepID=A0A841PRT2_9HYPH|nr:hypothetical protein [Mesorhizobium sangaii]
MRVSNGTTPDRNIGRRRGRLFQADGTDEAGTLSALKTHRLEMADGKIAEHQGRIVKLTGDGMLVEFPSVVNAVARPTVPSTCWSPICGW